MTDKRHKQETTEKHPSRNRQEAVVEGGHLAEEVEEEQEGKKKPSELEVLQNEIALLDNQLQEMRNRYLRAMADLDNTRKRARREMAEAQVHAVSGVLFEILAIVDNFERALETVSPTTEASQETKAVYDGIVLIYRQLMDMLTRRGVKPIEALGKPFDANLHEAVAQAPAANEQEEGTVALEMQRGYRFGDRVLRPSKVGVAVREAAEENQGE